MKMLIFYGALALWVAYTAYQIYKCEKEKRRFGDWTKVYVKKVLRPLLKKVKK